MAGFLIAFVLGIFVMGALAAQRERLGSGGFNAWLRGKKGLAVGVVLLIILAALVSQALVTVQAGTVGVVKRLGAVRGDLAPGLHTIVPFIDRVVIFARFQNPRVLVLWMFALSKVSVAYNCAHGFWVIFRFNIKPKSHV